MALHFNHNLQQALQSIQAEGYHELLIHDQEEKRDLYSSCEIIESYCESDGRFPHHIPNPQEEESLRPLIRKVKKHKADLGIAIDGDADRAGAVDE